MVSSLTDMTSYPCFAVNKIKYQIFSTWKGRNVYLAYLYLMIKYYKRKFFPQNCKMTPPPPSTIPPLLQYCTEDYLAQGLPLTLCRGQFSALFAQLIFFYSWVCMERRHKKEKLISSSRYLSFAHISIFCHQKQSQECLVFLVFYKNCWLLLTISQY